MIYAYATSPIDDLYIYILTTSLSGETLGAGCWGARETKTKSRGEPASSHSHISIGAAKGFVRGHLPNEELVGRSLKQRILVGGGRLLRLLLPLLLPLLLLLLLHN